MACCQTVSVRWLVWMCLMVPWLSSEVGEVDERGNPMDCRKEHRRIVLVIPLYRAISAGSGIKSSNWLFLAGPRD